MARIDLLLFGYYSITVCGGEGSILTVTNLFLKNGIAAEFKNNESFVIPASKRAEVEKFLFGKVDYEISGPFGLIGVLNRLKKSYGLMLGIICTVFMIFFFQSVVWDVRIEGDESLNEAEIIKELENAGLVRGKLWFRIDNSEIEINALHNSNMISWLNINRRGTVAYVKAVGKESHTQIDDPKGYASIVAVRDCVIEEILVEKGYAVVKKGDSVRAGEVLISGIIPTELGGGFCYAKGTVLGRYSEKVSVSVENTVSEKVYLDERTVDRSLKIFSLNINIFKRYGHLPQNCDIIEAKEDITLYKRLPISFVRSIAKPYEIKTYGLSDEEMVLTASEQLSKKLVEFLSDKDVIRMRTSGGFFEGKYTMVCDTVVSCDITRIQEFDVNNG